MAAHRRPPQALPPDAELVAALRAGEESAFAALIDVWSPGMLRTARAFVADAHTAEDVVQETWLAMLRGLHQFLGRSSLRTWTYQILINVAKTRGRRDARTVPESSLAGISTIDGSVFRGTDEPYAGHWRTAPDAWQTPESSVIVAEVRRHLEAALGQLPARQRAVIALRDVEGYPAEEVCQILNLSPANQRVLLHRARATVRASLAAYLSPTQVGEAS